MNCSQADDTSRGLDNLGEGKHEYAPAMGTYDRVWTIPTALPVAARRLLAAAAAMIITDVLATGAVGLVGNASWGGGGLLGRLRQGESAGGEDGEED